MFFIHEYLRKINFGTDKFELVESSIEFVLTKNNMFSIGLCLFIVSSYSN
jgi:hypothetical protein